MLKLPKFLTELCERQTYLYLVYATVITVILINYPPKNMQNCFIVLFLLIIPLIYFYFFGIRAKVEGFFLRDGNPIIKPSIEETPIEGIFTFELGKRVSRYSLIFCFPKSLKIKPKQLHNDQKRAKGHPKDSEIKIYCKKVENRCFVLQLELSKKEIMSGIGELRIKIKSNYFFKTIYLREIQY